MLRRPPRLTPPDTLFPYTPRFRSPLGGGRAEIHQHRHFGYIAAQFGAADDAMLVDQVLRVTTAAHGFREPHHRNPLDLAPLLDRGELDPEGAELVDFLLGDLEAV